jgi:rhamnulokinase
MSILCCLACRYREVIEAIEQAAGIDIRKIRVVGGGARNELLCKLTAAICERPVVAGPIEATALGNLLVQGRAAGCVASIAEGRALVASACRARVFEPDELSDLAGEATYRRFRSIVGVELTGSVL